MKTPLVILLCLLFTASTHAQGLSAIEKQIIASIEEDMPATYRLLEESVNINSGTFNLAGVRKTGELYGKELEALGFAVSWVSLPDSLQRAGHLVASRKGRKGKRLFLVGHLDTVFEPDMPSNPFKRLDENRATGQGVIDMKGGDVLVIAALKALHKRGLLEDVTITVYFTGDEENAGRPRSVSRGDYIERAKQHDIALAFEPAAGLSSVVTARRGTGEWTLETEGRQAHSSGVFTGSGYGAIYEASRIIQSFRERLGKQPYLSFNPGLFIGGSEVHFDAAAQRGEASGKTNIISPKAVVMGDIRFISEKQKEQAQAQMRQIVSQHLPGSKAVIRFREGIPAMSPTAGNVALARLVSEVSLDLGYGAVKAGDPGSRGAGDISYIAAYLDCLDGLGASGSGAHEPGEILNLKEYPKLIKRAALLMYRLTK